MNRRESLDGLIFLPPVKSRINGLATSGPNQILVGGDLGLVGRQGLRGRINTRSFLLRAKLLLFLFCLGPAASPVWAVFSVCLRCNWRGDAPVGAACPNCGYGGTSSNSGGSAPYNGPNIWDALRERRERKAAEARQAAWDANQKGVEFAAKQDWASAIKSYQLSLAKEPNDPVVMKNLASAQARLANDRGLEAYNRGDWAAAVRFFEEALKKNPYPQNNGIIQNSLTTAQSKLQSEQAEQQDKAAAAVMQQSIQKFTQSLNAKPAAPKPAGGNGGGLDFISASPSPGATKPAAALEFGDPLAKGAFGGNESNAKFVTVEAHTPGSNTKAGDQLKSAAVSGDLKLNFDIGGAPGAGSLTTAHTVSAGPPPPMDLSHFSERAKKDPEIVASLGWLTELQTKRRELDTQRTALTKERNLTMDPAAMQKLTEQLDKKNKEFADNLTAISEKTEQIEKRHREIDNAVEDTPANNAAKPVAK